MHKTPPCEKKQFLHAQVLPLPHMASPSHHSKRSHLPFNEAKKALLEEHITKCTQAENHDSIEDSDFEYYKKTTSRWTLPPCSPRKEFMELDLAEDTSLVCSYPSQLSILLSLFFWIFFLNFFFFIEWNFSKIHHSRPHRPHTASCHQRRSQCLLFFLQKMLCKSLSLTYLWVFCPLHPHPSKAGPSLFCSSRPQCSLHQLQGHPNILPTSHTWLSSYGPNSLPAPSQKIPSLSWCWGWT